VHNMVKSVRHTGLVVVDLERSLGFYRDILGLIPCRCMTESGEFIEKVVGFPGAVVEWVKLQAPDGSLIELLQYHTASDGSYDGKAFAKADCLGFSHIAFTVRDIEILYNCLCQKGYHCNSAPQMSPDGMVKVMYCHDPDGIIVELVEELFVNNKEG